MNSEDFERKWELMEDRVEKLQESIETLQEQQETTHRNQKELAEGLGTTASKIDAVASADGGSQQSTEVTDEQLIKALAEVGADPRSKAEFFGVSDD